MLEASPLKHILTCLEQSTCQARTITHSTAEMVTVVVADSSISLWKSNTGSLISKLSGHRAGVMCIKLHPLKGSTLYPNLCPPYGARCNVGTQATVRLLLISGGADHAILLWDVRAGICLQKLASHAAPVTALIVSGCSVVSLAGVRCSRQHVQKGSLLCIRGSSMCTLYSRIQRFYIYTY